MENKHYSPPDSKDWVDAIRKKGNIANHKISIMTKEEAEEIISFSEMLLRYIFEYPSKARKNNSDENE